MTCGDLLLRLLSFFHVSCAVYVKGAKEMLIKMTGDVRGVFWEKEKDKIV